MILISFKNKSEIKAFHVEAMEFYHWHNYPTKIVKGVLETGEKLFTQRNEENQN